MILEKNEKKQMRGWTLGRYFLVLIALYMNSLTLKQIKFY